MTNYTTKVAEPTAHITVRKQRVKQNGKNVYLDNHTEFELELYNPTNTKLKATIEFDGKLISTSGIVLRPGERIFLDRYLDVDRKFLYETYEVTDTKQNREAIDNNGLVKVRFYEKQEWQNIIFGNSYPLSSYFNLIISIADKLCVEASLNSISDIINNLVGISSGFRLCFVA